MLTRIKSQILINKFNNLSVNQQVHMVDPVVNYVLRPFEGNNNPEYPQGIKIYIQATRGIYKEADKVDISVSNTEVIIDHFLGIANKYFWVSLVFMVSTGAGAKNIFRQVDQNQIIDIHTQVFAFFNFKEL